MEIFTKRQNQRIAFQSNNWLKIHGLPMSRKRYTRRNESIFQKCLGIPIPPEKDDDNCFLKKATSMPISKITVSKEEREQMNQNIGVILGRSIAGRNIHHRVIVYQTETRQFMMYLSRSI